MAPLVAVVAAAGLAACDPPLPPDGRDLGVVLDTSPPAVVAKGETVVVTGTVTNHGTTAADGARVAYGVTGGFTVDDLVVGVPAACGATDPSGRWCDLTEPLEPGAETEFTATLTAGSVSGAVSHVALAGSAGTEPEPDPSANAVVVQVDVRPEPAEPGFVALSNDTNYLGTGHLLGPAGTAGHPDEGLYLSVNPYCTAKENGDRFQSGYGGTCAGNPNPEYRSSGYTYAIDVPADVSSSIDVLLYDARYNEDVLTTDVVIGENCTWTYGPWNDVPAPSTPFTLVGQAQYQLWTGTSWGTTNVVSEGASLSFDGTVRYRYRTATKTCTPQYRTEVSPDDERVNDGRDAMTFSLYAADSTPLDDTDNPLICSATYQWDTPFDPSPFLGSYRWNRLCRITTSMPSGRYFLRVRNSGATGTPLNDGSNQFGIAAVPAGVDDPAQALCRRSDAANCPVVSGPGEASIRVAANTNMARIGLGSVGAEHEGRELTLELYDPGEGGNFLRVLRPTGPGTWGPAPFTWTAPGLTGPASPVTSVDVTQSRFNGRLLSIKVDLTGYAPPPGNDQWFVEYNFGGGLQVTDRTTWTAWIADHPAP